MICSIDQKNRGNVKAAVILASLCSIPAANAMPPNIHADYDIVPGMKVVSDGIPINDFLEEFMRPLDMGLGQIVQDGFSLLSFPDMTTDVMCVCHHGRRNQYRPSGEVRSYGVR